MTAIYNEIEPFAVRWMSELVARNHIAPGIINDRSISDLAPADVAGHGQRHFFAGIGGWSYALRLAGVHDGADVWTGSCPCQPFSTAGKRSGTRDARHLWPTWFDLIAECRPPIVFGEQVASSDGLAWLDLVRADLERCGYAFGASDLCAAGVGAPHIRQRLYWAALLGDADGGAGWRDGGAIPGAKIPDSRRMRNVDHGFGDSVQDVGSWDGAEWLDCLDGNARPIEPSAYPLAHGVPVRMGRLRGYGNAIVPQVAATFIRAALEAA